MLVNTIPLLKNTFICGHGAGTFSFYFPQNDYVGLANTHGSSRFVIDKPIICIFRLLWKKVA